MKHVAEQTTADSVERYNFACKIARGKSVLDVACGSGYSTQLFLEAGALSYDGVDISEEHITYANYRYANKVCADRVNYHIGDMSTFDNGKTFDIITCYGIISHVEDCVSAIKNFYSLLNYGGVLLISSTNRMVNSPYCSPVDDEPSNEFHIQDFTPNELLSLLDCSGFDISQEKVFGQHQRRVYSDKFLNKIVQAILKKTKSRKGAVVTEVKNKAPEHFIIVATKV